MTNENLGINLTTNQIGRMRDFWFICILAQVVQLTARFMWRQNVPPVGLAGRGAQIAQCIIGRHVPLRMISTFSRPNSEPKSLSIGQSQPESYQNNFSTKFEKASSGQETLIRY